MSSSSSSSRTALLVQHSSCPPLSSRGWIIELNMEQGILFLSNPLHNKALKFDLPTTTTPNAPSFGNYMVAKAILTSDPINKFGLVFIHGFSSKLAYLHVNDEKNTYWIDLHASHAPYADITCNQKYIFALSDDGCVDVWELIHGFVPMKKKRIEVLFMDNVLECEESLRDSYTSRLYLVESRGDLFLVMRCVGEFVREDGVVLRNEGELLDDEVYSHVDTTYMTKNFYVYKLDYHEKNWVQVETLGDEALFLGGNQSVCISASDFQESIKGNSIYFTDDYWDRMNVEEEGGHDMGVFYLKDTSIKEISPSDQLKSFNPPPLWIVENGH